jgi:hypothetical protein
VAASTTYTTLLEVKSLLPASYSSTDLPDSDSATRVGINSYLTRVSRWVDADLGRFYVTFNSTDNATYPTPAIIRQVATDRVLFRCYQQLVPSDRNMGYGEMAVLHFENAQAVINSIRDASDDVTQFVSGVVPNETVSAEALTFGTGGTYDLPENEAFVNVHSNLTTADVPTILVDSVAVTLTGFTGYRNSVTPHDPGDFFVYFHRRFKKWVFHDKTGAFSDDAGTKSITYDWSYLRYAEKQQQPTSTFVTFGGW